MRRVTIHEPLTPSISHPVSAILLNKAAHDTVIEKTVRGLYFHHTGKIPQRPIFSNCPMAS